MPRQLNTGDDFDAETELIRIEAEGIAKRHGIDIERVIAIYKRSPGIDLPVFAPFQTNLDRAIATVGKDKALQLFENEDLNKLAERLFLVDQINSFPLPLYSLDELEQLTEEFTSYLLQNRPHLLKTGQPPTKFDRSPWLDRQLARLYHFDFPPGIPSPPQGDRNRLKADRGKILDFKMTILKILSRATKRKDPVNLWDSCLRVLTEKVSSEEAEFYLRMDQFYMGYDITDRIDKGEPEEIPDLDRPGGFTDLLEVIGHFEKELTIGTLAETLNALADLLIFNQRNRPILFVSNYFEATEHPLRDTLDSALDLFSSLEFKEIDFWEKYGKRVNEALKNEFNVDFIHPVKVKEKFYHQLEPIAVKFLEAMKSHLEATGRPPRISISEDEDTKVQGQYVFRKQNDRWVIIYDGRRCPELKNKAGLKYIHYLLHLRPDEKVAALDLYLMDAPPTPASSLHYGKLDDEQLAREGLSTLRSHDRETITRKNIDRLRSDYNELKKQLKEATENNDIGRKEKFEEELKQFIDDFGSLFGLPGHPPGTKNPLEKARKVVTTSINRSKSEIYKLHEPLWHHLEAIHTGTSCSYNPKNPVSWFLD